MPSKVREKSGGFLKEKILLMAGRSPRHDDDEHDDDKDDDRDDDNGAE